MTRRRAIAALTGWLAGLAGAVAVLVAAGTALPAPPLHRPGALPVWLAATEPASAVVALLRLAALATASWLLVATLLCLVATATGGGSRPPTRLCGRCVRRLVATALGTSLALAPVVPAAAAETRPPVLPSEVPVLRWLPPDAPPDPPPAAAPQSSPAPPAPVHLVQPGEHLWSVAAQTLAAARARPVPTTEVAAYWRRVVEQNRSRLADPDLVHPGFAVQLPPLPAPGT